MSFRQVVLDALQAYEECGTVKDVDQYILEMMAIQDEVQKRIDAALATKRAKG